MLNRYVFILAFIMGLVMPIGNAFAQSGEKQFEPDTITVYGRTVTVQPFQMSQTDFTWRDMKPWLPEEITQTPDDPMSYRQIYDAVSEWVKVTGAEYEDEVDRLTRETLIEEKGEDYTEMDYDIRHKLFSDMFHIRGGEKISKSTYEAFNKNLAVLYLKDMLGDAFKYSREYR